MVNENDDLGSLFLYRSVLPPRSYVSLLRLTGQVSPFVSRSALRSGLDLGQDQFSYQQQQHMLMRKPWAPITPGPD